MNDRTRYIGGSDVAGILGVSAWSSPLKVYLEKRGEAEPPDEEDRKRERILERGRREEPHIIADLEKLTPIKVTKRSAPSAPNRYVDPEVPYFAAEIDAEWLVTREAVDYLRLERGIEIPEALIGTTQNLEAKTAHPFVAMKKFGDEGTDEMPIEYFTQCLHGLGVTGRQVTLLALAVYVDDPILYLVRRDDEMLSQMRERLRRFREDHVLAGVPPAPLDGLLADVYRMLKRRRATRLAADEEVAGMIRTLKALNARAYTTEEGINAVKFEIGCRIIGQAEMEKPTKKDLGRHVILVDGQPALTIALEEQERIDAERLRREHPQIAASVAKTIRFYKYNLSRAKS